MIEYLSNIPRSLLIDRPAIEKIINDSLSALNHQLDDTIELGFVSKDKILSLNKKYRDKERSTDVLSFPQVKNIGPENVLGSIIVCGDVVIEKKEEIGDVIKHGLLHLLGYDHEEDEKSWQTASELIKCGL